MIQVRMIMTAENFDDCVFDSDDEQEIERIDNNFVESDSEEEEEEVEEVEEEVVEEKKKARKVRKK